MSAPTLTEFVLARIAEREELAEGARMWFPAEGHDGMEEVPWMDAEWWRSAGLDARHAAFFARHDPDRELRECARDRRLVEFHESWPVLVEQPPTFEPVDVDDPNSFAMRASQQIAWMSQQEYRRRFGDEPPTAPMLAALAEVDSDHPDFRAEWRP